MKSPDLKEELLDIVSMLDRYNFVQIIKRYETELAKAGKMVTDEHDSPQV